MKAYRRLQWAILVIIVVYVVLGYGLWLLKLPEAFPAFSWELFTYVPARNRIDFGLLITAVDGEPLPEPVYFEQAEEFVAAAHSIDAIASIYEWGSAVADGEEAKAEYVRTYFESLFLRDTGVTTYQIILRHGDLLELWQTGTYTSESVLATYQME